MTGRFPVAASSDEVGAELNRRHVTDSSPHELLAGVNEATAGSETFTGNVPGNVLGTTATAVAYDARLRLCSDVLHFHGKGLRSGAFLFLAVPDATGGDTSRDGRIGSGLSGSTSTSNSDSGSGSGRCAKVLAVAADTTTGSCGTGVRVGLRIKDASERAGTGVEVRERAEKAGGRSGDGDGSSRQHAQAAGVGEEEDQRRTSRLPSPTPRAGSAERGFAGRDGAEGGGGELWVTDESAPLLSALSSQWAASAAPPAADDAGSSAAAKTRRSAHRAALTPPGATGGTPTTTAEGPRNDHPPIDHSFPVAVTLRVMPSGRAPLPPLCCGVCGSSWETDSFGRGYRSYHLAVANNASLVWYLKKRFSEFLALHAALSGRGGRGGEGDRIPEDRWVLVVVGSAFFWEEGGEIEVSVRLRKNITPLCIAIFRRFIWSFLACFSPVYSGRQCISFGTYLTHQPGLHRRTAMIGVYCPFLRLSICVTFSSTRKAKIVRSRPIN